MLKISDFSRLARVPSATLRYYDQLGLLKPAHVDRFTDYRYYDAAQLPRLNRILALKDLGFSLDQIAALVDREVAPAELRGMLNLRRADAERVLRESQQRLALVESRLREIEEEGQPSPFDIIVKQVEPLPVVSARLMVPTAADMTTVCDAQHGALRAWLDAQHIRTLPPPAPQLINLYHNTEYTEVDLDVELAVLVGRLPAAPLLAGAPTRLQAYELPAVQVASGVYQGPMDGFTSLIRATLFWIANNHYCVGGPLRELHLVEQAADGTALVELQVPILEA